MDYEERSANAFNEHILSVLTYDDGVIPVLANSFAYIRELLISEPGIFYMLLKQGLLKDSSPMH